MPLCSALPFRLALATGLFVAAGALPATAAEGVVEINQARADAGGVTGADAPGLPVTIGVRGSYRLTSDLNVPDAGTMAIDVNADDVTIDLGGFSIVGTVTCSGVPAACEGIGSGNGIDATGRNRVVVRNGRVRRMGNHGVNLQNDGRVEDVTVSENGGYGVVLAQDGFVLRVDAHQNGSGGIGVNGGRVAESLAEGNGGPGIAITTVGSVSGSLATSNGGHGITVGTRGLVTDSHAASNVGDGIRIGTGSIRDCQATSNATNGFVIAVGNLQSSAASSNASAGLRVSASGRAGYGNVVLTGNNGGADPQVATDLGATAHNLGGNVCGTDTTCP